jgi:hypothetical protein
VSRGKLPRAVAAVALLVLAGGVSFVLLDPRPRTVTATSRSLEATLVVPPYGRACEREVFVPAGARRVELVVSTAGKEGGPLNLAVRRAGRLVSSGRHPGGYSDSPVGVPLEPTTERIRNADVCVENESLVRIALLGAPLRRRAPTQPWIDDLGAPSGPPARVTLAGRELEQQPGRIRLKWQHGDDQSVLSYAGTIAERFGLVKTSFFGSRTMWVALALALLASFGALALVLREVKRP